MYTFSNKTTCRKNWIVTRLETLKVVSHLRPRERAEGRGRHAGVYPRVYDPDVLGRNVLYPLEFVRASQRGWRVAAAQMKPLIQVMLLAVRLEDHLQRIPNDGSGATERCRERVAIMCGRDRRLECILHSRFAYRTSH